MCWDVNFKSPHIKLNGSREVTCSKKGAQEEYHVVRAMKGFSEGKISWKIQFHRGKDQKVGIVSCARDSKSLCMFPCFEIGNCDTKFRYVSRKILG